MVFTTEGFFRSNYIKLAVFLLSSLVTGWSKFHVNILIRFGVTTLFVYKGLTRNLEIGNASV